MSKAENSKHLSLLETIHFDGDNGKRKSGEDAAGNEVARPRASIKGAAQAEREPVGEQKSPQTPIVDNRSEPALRGPAQAVPNSRKVSAQTSLDALTFEVPRRRKRRSIGGYLSFVLCVLLPTIVAGVYYFAIASDQYVVQFRFAVRDTSTSVSTSAATAELTAMVGLSTSSNPSENYMVTEFMTSRQAVEELQASLNIRKLYSRPFIDFASRLDPSVPIETLARYWKRMVTAEYDQVTGIAVAEVHAFTAEDALLISQSLLSLGENLINEVAQRPQREALRYSEIEVKRAEDRLRAVRAELSDYRDKAGFIEPNSSVVSANAAVAATIRSVIAQIQTDISTLKNQGMRPTAPSMQSLQMRLKATEEQLKAVESQVSLPKQTGDNSISQAVARYEQLDLERQFAQNLLTSTMQSLEQARSNAATKRIFVVAFVQPSLPQASTYPRRGVATLTVAIACLIFWTVGLLVSRSIREHLT
jgi:capsular polysaccharide transport system permease protein